MKPGAGWGERFLEWILPTGLAEEVIGDLREEWYSGDARRPGPTVRAMVILSIVVRLHANSLSLESLPRNLKLAFRRMRWEPGVTTVFVAAIGLGVGVNMVMLSVANAVMLGPLPYPDADRIAVLSNDHRGSNTGGFGVSYESARDIPESVPSVEALGLYLDWQDVTYDTGDGARRMAVAFVSSGYVGMLGLEASLGRLFDGDETGENAAGRVALIGNGAWETLFGGDPSVLGRTLTLNGSPFEVVGVTSDDRGDLRYLWGQDPVQLYLPLFAAEELVGIELDADRGNRAMSALVRLREGASLETARAELAALSAELDAEFPSTNEGWTFHLADLHDEMFSELRAPVAAILGISVLVLLLVAVNLTTLSLLRATGRMQSVAVRRALGASRGGIVAQSLAETSLLALVALVVALIGARLTLAGLGTTSAVRLPSFSSIALDSRALGIGCALAAALALLLAVLPATVEIRGAGMDLLRSRPRGSAGGGTGRIQNGLVAAQVAVAVVLLTGAGLLLKSYAVLRGTDYGFDTERLLLAQVDLRSQEWDTDALHDFALGVVSEARGLPWVEDVFVWGPNRLGNGNRVAILAPEGRWATNPEQRFEASRHSVLPGALASLGIELLSGRDVSRNDVRESPRVAVISESMARALWPDASPIGRRMEADWQGERASVEVVGVAADARHRTRMVDPFGVQRDVYYPFTQVESGLLTIALRHARNADLEAVASSIRRIVRDRTAAIPVYGVTTMEERMRSEEGPARMAAVVMVLYAGLTVALAALGLFGVLSHGVRLRAREIGVRKALGAEQRSVIWLVVRRGLLVTMTGVAVGALVAVPFGRLIQAALYGVEPGAPSVTMTVWFGLVLVAVAACWLPARLAAGVPPAEVLRAD